MGKWLTNKKAKLSDWKQWIAEKCERVHLLLPRNLDAWKNNSTVSFYFFLFLISYFEICVGCSFLDHKDSCPQIFLFALKVEILIHIQMQQRLFIW